jgi:hypothetical protein
LTLKIDTAIERSPTIKEESMTVTSKAPQDSFEATFGVDADCPIRERKATRRLK